MPQLPETEPTTTRDRTGPARVTRGAGSRKRNQDATVGLLRAYSKVLQVVGRYAIRIPALETLEPAPLLQRERTLRRRLQRVRTQSSCQRGWARRHERVCRKLAAARTRALVDLQLDKQILDAFVDAFVENKNAAQELASADRTSEEAASTPLSKTEADATRQARRELRALRAQVRCLRGEIVMANRGLVATIARRYTGRGLLMDDLMQEGNLGILRAIDRFDPDKGCQFSTYAMWWLRQSMTRAVANQARTVRVPVHVTEEVARIRRAENRLTQKLGRAPDPTELAKSIEVSAQRLSAMRQRMRAEVSMQRPQNDGDGQFMDTLTDETAEESFDAIDASRLASKTRSALDRLDERSRFIVSARYGFSGGDPMTLSALGEALAISRERVRQLETAALKELRRFAREQHLEEFV